MTTRLRAWARKDSSFTPILPIQGFQESSIHSIANIPEPGGSNIGNVYFSLFGGVASGRFGFSQDCGIHISDPFLMWRHQRVAFNQT